MLSQFQVSVFLIKHFPLMKGEEVEKVMFWHDGLRTWLCYYAPEWKWLLPAPLQISFLHFYPTRLGITPQWSTLLQWSCNITNVASIHKVIYKVSISFSFVIKIGIKKEIKGDSLNFFDPMEHGIIKKNCSF